MTLLCLASYDKGHEFLRQCRRQGCRVVLITSQSLQEKAEFPADAVDELFHMRDEDNRWDRTETLNAVSYLARTRTFDRIVPLDDFDLEMAALLREHLRVPGMGETTTRHFRDKLAMRMVAREAGLAVPEFVHALNHERVQEFLERVPGPWVLKPRSSAGAIGIKKVGCADELWPLLDALGDMQSHYLLERYVPGEIFHVDSIVSEGEIVFAVASGYGRPPLDVSHEGGIFTTRLLERGSEEEQALLALNAEVLPALRLVRGVSHTEFIRGRDGELYFLETSARVGGANIADLIEAATGVNLWAEWAKIEIAGGKAPYEPPPVRQEYAGLLVTLARQEWPDTAGYADPEVVWRMRKRHHVGLIVRSPERERVQQLLDAYGERVMRDFWAYAPPREKAVD